MRGIGSIYGGQSVKVHMVLLQQFQPLHDTSKGSLAVSILPVYVVQVLRTVDAESDAELMVMEKATPVISEQRTIGL